MLLQLLVVFTTVKYQLSYKFRGRLPRRNCVWRVSADKFTKNRPLRAELLPSLLRSWFPFLQRYLAGQVTSLDRNQIKKTNNSEEEKRGS